MAAFFVIGKDLYRKILILMQRNGKSRYLIYENSQMRAIQKYCKFLSLRSGSRKWGRLTIHLEERDGYIAEKGTAWGC